MSLGRTLFTLLGMCLCLAVQPASAQHTIVVACSGFESQIDNNIYFRVVHNTMEVANMQQVVYDGAPTYYIMCLADTGEYVLDVFVDANKNAAYDAGVDPSWRFAGIHPTGTDVQIALPFDLPTTEITYPSSTPFSQQENNYGGSWRNLTFSTTGPAQSQLSFDAKTGAVEGWLTVSGGAFGQPNPVTFTISGEYDATTKEGVLNIQEASAGFIGLNNGQLSGEVVFTTFGVTLMIMGNYSENLIMFTYQMTGAFKANGYIQLSKQQTMSVEDAVQPFALSGIAPNPTASVVALTYDSGQGDVLDVTAVDACGTSTRLPFTIVNGTVQTTVADLPVGWYTLLVRTQRGVQSGRCVVAR